MNILKGFTAKMAATKFGAVAKRARGGAALSLAREIVFPLGCALCGEPLFNRREAVYGICQDCAAHFDMSCPLEKRCRVCGKPLISEHDICIGCRNREKPPAYDGVLVLYPYIGSGRSLLSAYKFGNHRPLARFFAEKLYRHVQDAEAGIGRLFREGGSFADWQWVPAPTRAGKLKEKGWDQIALIARVLERDYSLPISRCLKRLNSQSQKELGKQSRQTNLVGHIIAAGPVPRRVILFDDVYTTGSTLNVCAGVLKEHGAEHVFGLCLFYD
ncbi:MAG: ComF family protein [Spirochaetaceae bacterium]|jgi:ComF family protein|nr:ComF family protein [Spirochaetaceae bacterium]